MRSPMYQAPRSILTVSGHEKVPTGGHGKVPTLELI